MGAEKDLAEEAKGIPNSDQDQKEVLDLYSKLRKTQAKLIGADGKTQVLPDNVHSFFYRLLADLTKGDSVTIFQRDTTLTTVEAAKFLGVSRQFLIQEIEKKKIPYHMVGTHRRLYARDVHAYKSKRDANRRKHIDDLAMAEYEEGLYEKAPPTGKPPFAPQKLKPRGLPVSGPRHDPRRPSQTKEPSP